MLNNLKVLELANVLAGPSVGQFFAELGAEVIKVENALTGGDVTRSWKSPGENADDRSAYFCSVNWGKKSVTLDLTTKEGKSIVQKLAQQSDIIIASYKPGDGEKLGVSYRQLRARNPALIYGQITGYGSDNERVGYDAVLQAETGFMDLNGEPGGPPTKMPVALIDVLAGHQLKEGLLLALLKKQQTGVGALVEVSLIETALASLVNQASNWLVAGKQPTRQGSAHPNIAPYGESFETADSKQVLLAIGSDRQFYDLCDILGIARRSIEGRFATNQMRVANRGELASIIGPGFKTRDSTELLQRIHEKKIPAGIIQTVREALTDPEVGSIFLTGDGIKGIRNFVGHFSFFPATATPTLSPPPHLGEHTGEIIARISR